MRDFSDPQQGCIDADCQQLKLRPPGTKSNYNLSRFSVSGLTASQIAYFITSSAAEITCFSR